MFKDLLKTRTGIILISILWGLGLSTIFRKACQGRNCHVIVYQGPKPSEIEDTYYTYGNNKCYKYYPIMSKCN